MFNQLVNSLIFSIDGTVVRIATQQLLEYDLGNMLADLEVNYDFFEQHNATQCILPLSIK